MNNLHFDMEFAVVEHSVLEYQHSYSCSMDILIIINISFINFIIYYYLYTYRCMHKINIDARRVTWIKLLLIGLIGFKRTVPFTIKVNSIY